MQQHQLCLVRKRSGGAPVAKCSGGFQWNQFNLEGAIHLNGHIIMQCSTGEIISLPRPTGEAALGWGEHVCPVEVHSYRCPSPGTPEGTVRVQMLSFSWGLRSAEPPGPLLSSCSAAPFCQFNHTSKQQEQKLQRGGLKEVFYLGCLLQL